ncbi:MAG: alpha/beta hydrolase [Myxococcota bacterium]
MSIEDEVEATLARAQLVELPWSPVSLRVRCLHVLPENPGADRRFVLLHGNPSHLGHFARTIPFLAKEAEVLAFDLPGFGGSDAPEGPLDLDFLADVTLAMLDHFGMKGPVDVIGQSHGGAVAQTFLARHPERGRSGILLSTMGYPAHASMRVAMLPGIETLATLAAKTLAIPFLRPFGDMIGNVEAWASFAPDPIPQALVEREIDRIAARPEIQRSSVRANDGDPTLQLWAQAPKIRAPVLFVHAAQDRLVPIANARSLFQRLQAFSPESRFVTLEEGGHMAHLVNPAETERAIQGWLL